MEHHADFAVPVSQKLDVETVADPGDGLPKIAGRVIALGWWVEPASNDTDHVAAGTLYLVADQRRTRPYWVKQADLIAIRLVE
ncbi:MAG: hypothetical protein ACRDZM_18990 [Acidimicrobiia bacterium]